MNLIEFIIIIWFVGPPIARLILWLFYEHFKTTFTIFGIALGFLNPIFSIIWFFIILPIIISHWWNNRPEATARRKLADKQKRINYYRQHKDEINAKRRARRAEVKQSLLV